MTVVYSGRNNESAIVPRGGIQAKGQVHSLTAEVLVIDNLLGDIVDSQKSGNQVNRWNQVGAKGRVVPLNNGELVRATENSGHLLGWQRIGADPYVVGVLGGTHLRKGGGEIGVAGELNSVGYGSLSFTETACVLLLSGREGDGDSLGCSSNYFRRGHFHI
jgi:hypothetical protein